jgi:hypothetical protein
MSYKVVHIEWKYEKLPIAGDFFSSRKAARVETTAAVFSELINPNSSGLCSNLLICFCIFLQ